MPRNNIYFDEQSTGGRPRLVLNEEGKRAVRSLGQIQCTEEEIASFMGVTVEVFKTEWNKQAFQEELQNGKNNGKASLRRIQFKLAEKNPSMAIWLGKNFLGQRDDIITNLNIQDSTAEEGIKIQIIDKKAELPAETEEEKKDGNS